MKGDQATVRAINCRLLLRLVRERGRCSRTDLAAWSGLSAGAVTRIVEELIGAGLLAERAVGVSRGGRRPVLLDLNAAGRAVAGLKIMDHAISAVLVDLKGTVIADRLVELDNLTVDSVLPAATDVIGHLMATVRSSRRQLAGVGVCMPGVIDWRSGVCRVSPYFGWHDVPLAQLLTDRLGVPVVLDNDVNALAVAECLFDRGRQVQDFALVTLGRGVGAGLVLDGSVQRGFGGGAGELGHLVSELDGRDCECGNRGCLEAYVGEKALVQRARELGPDYAELDLAGFLSQVARGDRRAADLYADLVARLGAAIANLVNLVGPELVFLGGEAGYLTEGFVAELRQQVVSHVFGGSTRRLAIELDEWRDDRTAWARGAACLGVEAVLDPLLSLHSASTA